MVIYYTHIPWRKSTENTNHVDIAHPINARTIDDCAPRDGRNQKRQNGKAIIEEKLDGIIQALACEACQACLCRGASAKEQNYDLQTLGLAICPIHLGNLFEEHLFYLRCEPMRGERHRCGTLCNSRYEI